MPRGPVPPRSCRPNCCDVEKLPALVDFAVRSFGTLDVLINNASTFYPTPIGEITRASLGRPARHQSQGADCSSRRRPRPRCGKSRGLIINIVDIHALRPLRDHTVYCTAKAGLHMLTRSLAKELGPEVRVNGIRTGPILWPDGQVETRRSATRSSSAPSSSAWARLRTSRARHCSSPRTRRYITGQISPSTAAAASPGAKGDCRKGPLLPAARSAVERQSREHRDRQNL